MTEHKANSNTNFIKNIINDDLNKNPSLEITTRFPPEPNGYLHIGHAKSICLNFGISQKYEKAHCNLRFDDTNPSKENIEYVKAIENDIKWLGFKWKENIKFASDYFSEIYEQALKLIKMNKAYVCFLTQEETKLYRGTLKEAGKESPYRNNSIEENLKHFEDMKQGKYKEGECVLRAKIDMSSGNINMRDPVIYRVLKTHHHKTQNQWNIYPMYDFTHCLSDAIENITHSLCTLEFQDHRPLYNWFLEQLKTHARPQQIEFARLNLNYTVTSKRKLKELIDKKYVAGWDDPRLPTILGLRRRGYTPRSIINFCEQIGISKKETTIDMSILEESVRQDLNEIAPRKMCVIDPIKIIITNLDQNRSEDLVAPNHPQNESMGHRKIPFSKEIFIEKEDFCENPPAKYYRLSPGKEVRLRYSYIIKCEKVIKNSQGEMTEIHCSYDPNTLGKKPEGRKVKGIIHWVCAKKSQKCEVRLYDRLFNNPEPDKQDELFTNFINSNSMKINKNSFIENSSNYLVESSYQFERLGYFSVDKESNTNKLIFNKTVSLKDTWQKK